MVGLPVFLYQTLGWSFAEVGAFLALWVIAYGIVQASSPVLLRRSHQGQGPGGRSALGWALVLAVLPAVMASALQAGWAPDVVVIVGLIFFAVVFAINSAIHSYLILAYSQHDRVAMNVGFYYMSNAGGRLAGTVLSGLIYQTHGLVGCLWWSFSFILMAALLSIRLPSTASPLKAPER